VIGCLSGKLSEWREINHSFWFFRSKPCQENGKFCGGVNEWTKDIAAGETTVSVTFWRVCVLKKFVLPVVVAVGYLTCDSLLASDQSQLRESQQKWAEAVAQAGGNYSYKVSFSSFAGFGHVTEIIVRSSRVVERRFQEFGGHAPMPTQRGSGQQYKWVEKGAAIGTHKEGAAPRTIEQLYREAGEVLSQQLQEYERRYLQFDERGFVRSCFLVDTRIADDAPKKGVEIMELTLEQPREASVYRSPNGKEFPTHWGPPPTIETKDLRMLPGGYGQGSGTLAKWIAGNMEKDQQKTDGE